MTTLPDSFDEIARCPQCDYLLAGLTELRCPECGRPFDADFVAQAPFRSRLLAWERPECGKVTRRVLRTVWSAFAHPSRFFARARGRIEQRIANRGWFILSCVLASLVIYGAEKRSNMF